MHRPVSLLAVARLFTPYTPYAGHGSTHSDCAIYHSNRKRARYDTCICATEMEILLFMRPLTEFPARCMLLTCPKPARIPTHSFFVLVQRIRCTSAPPLPAFLLMTNPSKASDASCPLNLRTICTASRLYHPHEPCVFSYGWCSRASTRSP